MKFLVDAQLPPALCGWLEARGAAALHVAEVFPGEIGDAQIAAFAVTGRYVVITKDDDFAFRHALPGLQIVWLRIGNASNRRLAAWLNLRWPEIFGALSAGECIVEVR